MDVLILALAVLGAVFQAVFAFALFHIVRWLLVSVSRWREKNGLRPFPDKACFLLALFSALSLVI